jgi:hypothetical protein
LYDNFQYNKGINPYYPKVIYQDQAKYSTNNITLEEKWLGYYTKSFNERYGAFWNKIESSKNISYRLNHLKIQNLTFNRKLNVINLIQDRFMKIKDNKIETKLTVPFYNFSRTNLESLMPNYFYHWQTSEFNFNNKHNNYWSIDLLFTKKLLSTFFSVSYVSSVYYWNWDRINLLFLIDPKSKFASRFKSFIKVTTSRTSSLYNDLSIIPKHVLKFKWYKNSNELVSNVKNAIWRRDGEIITYHVFNEFFLSYFKRPYLSLPRFKHTVSNVVIDLFIFNNKQYKWFKFMNILSRRGLYKYMYSMYANYSHKIQDTLNRPKFFYLNLIYPNISTHYGRIINLYQKSLLNNTKSNIFTTLLLLFKNNNINNKVSYNNSEYFDSYKGGIYYSDKHTQKVKELDNIIIPVKTPNLKYSIKAFKNYFKQLEMKYNTNFDDTNLTLWSNKDLYNKNNNNYTTNKRMKSFGRDKFSLLAFKNRNLFSNNKRAINPKLAEKKLMSYYRYSLYQKTNNIPNNNNLNKSRINNNNKFIKREYHTVIQINKNSRIKPKSIHEILNIRSERIEISSKQKWDFVDRSLLNKIEWRHNSNNWENIYEKGIENINTSEYWYSIYYLSYLKKEYNKISKDIINSSTFEDKYNKQDDIVEYKSNKYNGNMHIYLFKNYDYKVRLFNGKLFKPYFRYMVEFYMYKKYLSLFSKLPNYINNSVLFDFVMVKTVFELLRYNYTSMIQGPVTAELYFIDKIRYYKSEFHTTSILTFLSSMLFIKQREKAPNNYWWTYDNKAGSYFNRVKYYGNISKNPQVLLPFMFYFEDLLYSIYGKWGLIRLWPLKKKVLSTTILAQLISEVTNSDSIEDHVTRYDLTFRDILGRVKKYIKYSNNESKKWYNDKIIVPWPKELLTYKSISKFNKFNKYDRKLGFMDYLVTYQNVTNSFTNKWNYNEINQNLFNNLKGRSNSNLSNNELMSIPLRRYIGYIKSNSDLVAYRSTIKGRTPKPGKAIRSEYYMHEYGNLSMPSYIDNKFRIKSHSLRRHRTTLYSDRSYAKHSFLNRNGILTLRLWLYSRLNFDIRDMLYYLSTIRGLYTNIINREYN